MLQQYTVTDMPFDWETAIPKKFILFSCSIEPSYYKEKVHFSTHFYYPIFIRNDTQNWEHDNACFMSY